VIELTSSQVTPNLRALFPQCGHAYRRSFAVLDGASRGRIFVDDAPTPRWAAVEEFSDDSVLYLTGSLTSELVADLLNRLRHDRLVTIGAPDNDPLLDLLPANPDHDGWDVDFEDRDPAVDLTLLSAPPAGLRLTRIDQSLALRCAWAPWMARNLEVALDHGLGYCLLDGDAVVSEAFAGPLVDDALEMATITHADYRGRGLATIVCAQTVKECERLCYQTWWNAALTNQASIRIARRLGYRIERQYRLFAWNAHSPA
jgi:RimJ/RimL family protein N-acetyltransferase